MTERGTLPSSAGGDPSLILYLGLNVLLLSIFLLLTSYAKVSDSKAEAVLTGLSSSFAGRTGESAPPILARALAPGAVDDTPSLRDLAELIRRSFPAAILTANEGGGGLVVSLLQGELFEVMRARLRPAAGHALKDIAALIAVPPAGWRFECEAVLEGQGLDRRTLSINPPIAARRAEALARSLAAGGVPLERVVVGVEHGTREAARLSFALRPNQSPGPGPVPSEGLP